MRMTLEGRGYVSDNYSCVSYQVVELKFKITIGASNTIAKAVCERFYCFNYLCCKSTLNRATLYIGILTEPRMQICMETSAVLLCQ
jgi:hypothetical protein